MGRQPGRRCRPNTRPSSSARLRWARQAGGQQRLRRQRSGAATRGRRYRPVPPRRPPGRGCQHARWPCNSRIFSTARAFGTRWRLRGPIQQGQAARRRDAAEPATELIAADGVCVTRRAWKHVQQAYLMRTSRPAPRHCRSSSWPSIYTLLPAPAAPAAGQGWAARRAGHRPARPGHDRPAAAQRRRPVHLYCMASSAHQRPVHEATSPMSTGTRRSAACWQVWCSTTIRSPVRAAAAEAVSTHHLRLTLTEGKYHQVKRMVAAVGKPGDGVAPQRHRRLMLPADLAPGQALAPARRAAGGAGVGPARRAARACRPAIGLSCRRRGGLAR